MAKKYDPEPIKDWVVYGDTDDKAGPPKPDTRSLSATTTASKIATTIRNISTLRDWKTLPEGWAKEAREYLTNWLSRTPVGRPVGSGYDVSHHLDRMEELLANEDAKSFTAAAERIAEEEGFESDTDEWLNLTRLLRRKWKDRHPG